MTAWWQLFSKAFNEEECKWIIEHGLKHKAVQATVGHGGKSVVDDHIRRSTVRWFSRYDTALAPFFARVEKMALQANANAFGFDLAGFHEVQFTEYNADNSGGYGWHEDLNWLKATPFDRKMSMVIQLSKPDEYTGGKLEFANDPLKDGQFSQQGDVIFFPSFNRHRVTPVKLGIRYSLVTWFIGPKFR